MTCNQHMILSIIQHKYVNYLLPSSIYTHSSTLPFVSDKEVVTATE